MDLHTLGTEELAQHRHGAALPLRQQKKPSWAIQPEGKFHASIAEYPKAVQFSPRPALIHTNNQYNGHIFVSPKFSLGKMVSQSGWGECHGANLSSGWGHFYSAIPLSVTCKGQIRCPPATGDRPFPTYHHRGAGDCCYLHLCWGESCESVLLCTRQNAKISAPKLQTI